MKIANGYAKCLLINFIMTMAILISLMSTLSYAEIFKWVDEKGIQHFSDRPHNNLLPTEPKQTGQPIFVALNKDPTPAKEKLQNIQGQWHQIASNPTIESLVNRVASTIKLPTEQFPEFVSVDSLLIIDDHKVTISPANKQNNNIQADSDNTKSSKIHAAKLAVKDQLPLESKGFWYFEQGFNPVVSSFLQQVHAESLKNMKNLEQVRFDVQDNKLMITVNLPKFMSVPQLQIIYEQTVNHKN